MTINQSCDQLFNRCLFTVGNSYSVADSLYFQLYFQRCGLPPTVTQKLLPIPNYHLEDNNESVFRYRNFNQTSPFLGDYTVKKIVSGIVTGFLVCGSKPRPDVFVKCMYNQGVFGSCTRQSKMCL